MTFWRTKVLGEMTHEEWEAVCDGCGKCCLHKLEDEDSGRVYYTNVACRLLDLDTCRCRNYAERTRLVLECLDLKRHDIAEFSWLPSTCAYRLLAEGKALPDWHPLVSGNPHGAAGVGVSVTSYAVTEADAEDFEDHIIEWLE